MRQADAVPTTVASPPAPDLGRMRAVRLARLRAQMREQGIDGAVLLHGPNVTYATGFVPDAIDATHVNHRRSIAVVPVGDDEPVHLHPHGGDTAGLEAEVGDPLWPELDDEADRVGGAISAAIGEVGGRRIAVDAITGAMARGGGLAHADLVDATAVLGPARLIKSEDELACIDLAQRLNEDSMVVAQAACVPGGRRRDVAGAFLRSYRELGGRHCEIDPIFEVMPRRVADGYRTSTGHVAFPTGLDDPTFEEGDLVWVDAGIGYEGYASDFGRTWVVGRDPTPAEQGLFDRFMTVLGASHAAVRPGATLGDVGRAAVDANNGVVPWLPHFYLAHGVGLESAEMPMIGTDLGAQFDDGFVLAAGMVLVFEPVIWEDGVGSYRAEEICAVTETGWRHLGGGHGYPPFQP